jgi:hypothetical protein
LRNIGAIPSLRMPYQLHMAAIAQDAARGGIAAETKPKTRHPERRRIRAQRESSAVEGSFVLVLDASRLGPDSQRFVHPGETPDRFSSQFEIRSCQYGLIRV